VTLTHVFLLVHSLYLISTIQFFQHLHSPGLQPQDEQEQVVEPQLALFLVGSLPQAQLG